MDKEQQIQQLLSSVCTILDDAMEQMDTVFHYAIITSYPTSDSHLANHFMTNVDGKALERLLIDAVKGMAEGEVKNIPKKEYLQ